MSLNCKDLLGLEHLGKKDLQTILDSVGPFKSLFTRSVKKVPTLVGKTVVTLFYEPSTRTRNSFEIAAKRLSADVVNVTVNTSSIVKGESLIDTGKTLEAMKADYLIIRHSLAGAPDILARNLNASIINAGDGFHEHPTQGLLDLYTMYEKKKKIEGLKVLLVGDILHSRVAKSNIWALIKMGAEIAVVGPPTLIPSNIEDLGVKVYYDLNEAIKKVDVVNILRIQLERQQENLFPSVHEYVELYQVTEERLAMAKPGVLIMHPGPMNRGIEISSDVADSPNAVINEQVTNGIAVRMAVLCLLKPKRKNASSD
ncbi:aspartate carbamoyltransferase [Endomicrobiia bacterium]|uniref:Aspartate carbamoyltransferase catalytic subunit n=1 Tax=Endomicrobium trichonymphae TaxID=1408204 RepID=PYRB_ENDTX|nr:aspartate carbamoyltransferase catalytic subunit [Candidatus Endomicrobium trichonymphae]B1GYY8.1 RecName: Full=Aspartate carbamoyltransferase catalytic subunit; AltName: Full=Aspartate transcarbamylase; Short=ATCase [Candidatus Endomicrobium trichonymphae]GHT04694.1 aspartate carbamoyltransferase [Endomicrobiia bacterium]BAG14231.1 aspartate carbamoyltransferase [Candidatus Endomicrobium trichonymphae]BAV59286.1 aspartate carbamoyltransferase [Candidatus Endomicrobium trichonymphae]GHT0767